MEPCLKYMGSKTFLLSNGLGDLLLEQTPRFSRFIDPFCGSAAVASFVAMNTDTKVVASDLQAFAVVLAEAILARDSVVDPGPLLLNWMEQARSGRERHPLWKACQNWSAGANLDGDLRAENVVEARELCKQRAMVGPVWNAYGGYYFSPEQALTFDYLRKYLPCRRADRAIALSSLIRAASQSAASPGHTAQPFGTTPGGLKAIQLSWSKDVEGLVQKYVDEISHSHARTKGRTFQGDVSKVIPQGTCDDLFFIDPPYSAVQYSRFYHVLETLAVGRRVQVTGAGRYPPLAQRPRSDFSTKQADAALDKLLRSIARKRSSVVLTFPEGKASNGLSGRRAQKIARRYFTIRALKVANRFSTLGGSPTGRAPRVDTKELILYLSPVAGME